MPYSSTTWIDDSSPSIDAANLNNLEDGVSKGAYWPDASANTVPVGNGSAWVYQLLKNAQVDPAAAIAYSKLALAGSIVNADVATGAAIAYAKLNLAAAVKDSDIASAQNLSKLSGVTGTPDGTKFLRDDGTWSTPPGQTTYRKTTAKIVNNTVVATDLLNGEITIAANAMGTSKKLVAVLWGDLLTNSGAAVITPQFQVVVGGTTVLDTGVPTIKWANNASRAQWRLEIECLEAGATNVQVWSIGGELTSAVTTGNINVAAVNAFSTGTGAMSTVAATVAGVYSGIRLRAGNVSALDTTSSKTFVVNVINGVANTLYETKLLGAAVDIT